MKGHNHTGVHSIDFYAYSSKMKNLNPVLKVIFSIITLLICIVADNIYVSAFIVVTMGMIIVIKGGMKFHDYCGVLTIPAVFILLGSVAIAAGISKNPVGQWNINLYLFNIYFSNESILKALNVIMKAFGAISAMYMMILTTNSCEIISVFKKLHMPNIIIDLMNMIYRFIFILLDVHENMKNSAESRLGYVDFKTSCYSFGHTAGNLLIVSLKKANAYYDAMESRCYDGRMEFLEEPKNIKTSHILWMAVYIFILVGISVVVR